MSASLNIRTREILILYFKSLQIDSDTSQASLRSRPRKELVDSQYVVRGPDSYDHCSERRYQSFEAIYGEAHAEKDVGTDQSQGRGQILSNINACLAVQSTIKSTLGPYGGDLLLVDENGRQTITNDGATVMKVCFSPSSLFSSTSETLTRALNTAVGHSAPCRAHPNRYSSLARCRMRRWNNLSRGPCR